MNVSPSHAEIDALPQELIDQLSAKAKPPRAGTIMAHVRTLLSEGPMSLDDILIGIFKLTGKVYERSSVRPQLHRMKNADEIEKAEDGTYCLCPAVARFNRREA